MYANRKETAIDKTDPSVEKHATGHAKNFNEAPVQKFGVQADKPVQFRCWNGLDKHAQAQVCALMFGVHFKRFLVCYPGTQKTVP